MNVGEQTPTQDPQVQEQQFVSIQQHLQKFENMKSCQAVRQHQRFQISNSKQFAQIPYQQNSAQIFRRPNHGQGFSNSKINLSTNNTRPQNTRNLNEGLVLNEQDFGNVVASYPMYTSSRQNCEQVNEFFPIKPLDLNVNFANNQQELQVQNLPNLQSMYNSSSQISNQPQISYQNLLYQSFPQVSNYNALSHQRHIDYTSIVNGNQFNDTVLQYPFVNFVPLSSKLIQGEFPQQIYGQEECNNSQSVDFQMDQRFRLYLMNRQRIEFLQSWQFQHGSLERKHSRQLYDDYAIQMRRFGGEIEQFSKEQMVDSAGGLYNWGANEKEGSQNLLFTKPDDDLQERRKPVDLSYYQPIPANKYSFTPQRSSQNSSQSNSQEDLVPQENSGVSQYVAPASLRQRNISYYDYYDDGDDDDDDDDDYDYEDEMDEEEIEYLLESARQLGIPENLILSDRDFESTDYEALLMLEKCNVNIGATKQEIQQVPTTLVTNQSNLKEEQCTICMEGFCVGNHVKNLPCGHVYHAECIDTWLAQKPVCPVCGLNWKEFLQNQT